MQIFEAIASNDDELVDELIENGASLGVYDDKGYTPLHRAVRLCFAQKYCLVGLVIINCYSCYRLPYKPGMIGCWRDGQ